MVMVVLLGVVFFLVIAGLILLIHFVEDWPNIRRMLEKGSEVKKEKLRLKAEVEKEKLRLEYERKKLEHEREMRALGAYHDDMSRFEGMAEEDDQEIRA